METFAYWRIFKSQLGRKENVYKISFPVSVRTKLSSVEASCCSRAGVKLKGTKNIFLYVKKKCLLSQKNFSIPAYTKGSTLLDVLILVGSLPPTVSSVVSFDSCHFKVPVPLL